MHDDNHSPERSWGRKFRDAFRGVKGGVRGQSSFFVHFFTAAAVLVAAITLNVDQLAEWCLLLICITVVLAAEMFNSALETMAKAITNEYDPHVGAALDISSAAVLLSSIGASIVGAIIFINRLGMLAGWW